MNDFDGVLDLQVESLVEALRRQQENRCRELIDAAERRANELLQKSRRELRQRMRQAVDEERQRREQALQQARYHIRTEKSQELQAHYMQTLRQAWPELIAELERRWSSEEGRHAWCEKLIDEAEAALGREPWTIEHPASWSGQDTRWLTRTLKSRDAPEASFRANPDGNAGLKIRCGSACLDGTIEGLLANRSRVEGLLLAAWEDQAGRSSSDRHD